MWRQSRRRFLEDGKGKQPLLISTSSIDPLVRGSFLIYFPESRIEVKGIEFIFQVLILRPENIQLQQLQQQIRFHRWLISLIIYDHASQSTGQDVPALFSWEGQAGHFRLTGPSRQLVRNLIRKTATLCPGPLHPRTYKSQVHVQWTQVRRQERFVVTVFTWTDKLLNCCEHSQNDTNGIWCLVLSLSSHCKLLLLRRRHLQEHTSKLLEPNLCMHSPGLSKTRSVIKTYLIDKGCTIFIFLYQVIYIKGPPVVCILHRQHASTYHRVILHFQQYKTCGKQISTGGMWKNLFQAQRETGGGGFKKVWTPCLVDHAFSWTKTTRPYLSHLS